MVTNIHFLLLLVSSGLVVANKKNPFHNKEIEKNRDDPSIHTIYDEYVVFFDTDCLKEKLAEKEYNEHAEKENAAHHVMHEIIDEFLDEYECYVEDQDKPDDFPDIGDMFVVVNKIAGCEDDDEKEIEWRDYCITEVEEDEDFDEYGTYFSNTCSTRGVEGALWNLNNESPYKSGGLEYINFDSAFDPQVDIVIMDSGVDSSHSQFSGITYELLYDAYPNHATHPFHDHGTHCAGTVLGNTYGVFKASASKIKLLDVRVLYKTASGGGSGSGSAIVNGYNAITNYIRNTKRKVVINMSFGGGNWAAFNNALAAIRAAGGISIAAAGNDNIDAVNKSPASSPDTITVGAHDKNNNKASFSNYGSRVDIWAPGVSIKSAVRGGGSATWQGTSMATPLVVGIAASILVSDYDLEFDQIKTAITNYAVFDVNDGRGNTNLPRAQIGCSEYCTAGHHPSFDKVKSYPGMDCWQNPSYENNWDAPLTAQNSGRLYFNGLYSVHDNGREDRRFRFRYCKPSGVSVSTANSVTLPYTSWDAAWYRGCAVNSAITKAYSSHDNGREDRRWQFQCTPLPDGYLLTECKWTGYLNSWDGVLNYNCPNNGLIRNIYSYHDNGKEDRRWRFECCRVAREPNTASIGYKAMDCWQSSSYENNWDAPLTAQNGRVYFNGLYSVHDNGREDRRFRFRYCKPSGVSVSTANYITLPYTSWDAAWYRGCGGNTAITRAYSVHDNGKEDRRWQFRCTPLHNSVRVTQCEWSGYLNGWDGVLNYNCPNNGLIRSIYSVHDNGKEDRRWRFECCKVVANAYSYSAMNVVRDSNYVNNWDGTHNVGSVSRYLCGQYSYHDNGREDRRFKWKRCKPSSGAAWQATKALSQTDWDREWSQTCACFNDGNSAMVKAYSYHDNGKEDRRWTFTCGILSSAHKLVNCGWTGYLNEWDAALNFDCPSNGVIRSIWSRHDNGREDRLWRFECCQFVSNNNVGFSGKAPVFDFETNDDDNDNEVGEWDDNNGNKFGVGKYSFEVSESYLGYIYVICALVMVNVICLVLFCWNKRRNGGRNKYKVVSMESTDVETDVDAI